MENDYLIADIVGNHINEETKRFQERESSPREMVAVQILERCYRYCNKGADQSEVFSIVPKVPGWNRKRHGAPWASADLASGEAGAEFVYAYLPVPFVERLLEVAETETGVSQIVAETITAGATVYLLNNLRQVVDLAPC